MSRGSSTPRAAIRVRVALAAVVLIAAAASFLLSGRLPSRLLGIISLWQLFPRTAALIRVAAGGALVAAGLALPVLLLSGLFGRWYCASLCPLGALQDLASWLGGRRNRYRRPATAARSVAAVLSVCLALLGAMGIASWLDPWSLFGRLLSYGVRPLVQLSTRADLLGFDPWVTAGAVAAGVAVLVMAVLRGRWFCGTLCPVGTVLGLLNRIAPFRLRMEVASCLSCGKCASRCPASCIDPKARRIDDSRCVYCLACLGTCSTGAIRYGRERTTPRPESAGMSRRRFLTALGGGAAAVVCAAFPGRSLVRRLRAPLGATTPPGSRSVARFLDSCTACGLCVSGCPSGVLQPSVGQLGPRGLLVPTLDYSISYCQYKCTTCLDLCPSGALERMPLERKKLVKIGDSVLVRERCIVHTQRTRCGACAEHCPTGAVRMVDGPIGIPEPVFTSAICIGCGACHHACPVRPERAITVSGLAVHRTAEKPTAQLLGAPEPGELPSRRGGGDFPF